MYTSNLLNLTLKLANECQPFGAEVVATLCTSPYCGHPDTF